MRDREEMRNDTHKNFQRWMLTIDAFQFGRPSQAPYVVECCCVFENAIV